jgi:gliding motility-associated-like protein
VRVEVLPELKTQSVNATTSICGEAGAEVSLSAVGGRSPYMYSVENESGSIIASNTTGSFTGIYAGNNTIHIQDAWGCTTTQNITVDSVNLALADFEADPMQGKAPLKVEFNNLSTGTNTYEWFVNGAAENTNRHWTTMLNPSGEYEIELITYNNLKECADTIVKKVIVFDSAQIIIPNIFTPNGDDINDYFSVTTFGVTKIRYQLFNRYNQLFAEGEVTLSSENSKTVLWDGTSNGTQAKPDVYFYIITTFDWIGRTKDHTGFVHLKR